MWGKFTAVLGVSGSLPAVRLPEFPVRSPEDSFSSRFWSVGGQTATPPSQIAKASGQTAVAPGQIASSLEPSWFWTLDGRTASRSGQTARACASCCVFHLSSLYFRVVV